MKEQAYIELYKKYRPRDFDSMVGQVETVASVRQSIIENKVPTAFLFSGQHGAGKTSLAWIVAKAVNCENLDLETGNPCNECPTCINIDSRSQLGVSYVSLANNGSVADLRGIVDRAQQKSSVRRQVWILDECHRMSKEAAEALLIPLEDENMKALFIFCSTEPEKIISTVKSRMQQRAIQPIETRDIAKRLAYIVENEKLDVSKESIIQSAIIANGSLRDGIKNLETVSLTGKLPVSMKTKILKALFSRDYVAALTLTQDMAKEGEDFVRSAEQLYSDFSAMLLILNGVDSKTFPNGSTLEKAGSMLGHEKIIVCLDIIADTLGKMIYNIVDNKILTEIMYSKIVATLK